MDRVVLTSQNGMIYTDISIWGTKIYLANDADEELFFEVPINSFMDSQTSFGNFDGEQL